MFRRCHRFFTACTALSPLALSLPLRGTMNLILLHQRELSNDTPTTATLKPDDERTEHIVGRLKKQSGDTVSVGIIGGSQGKAAVDYVDVDPSGNDDDNNHSKSTHRRHLKLTLLQNHPPFAHPPEPEPEITLLLALPFPSRLKSLWSTIASFSYVTRIVIIRGQLSDPEHGQSSALSPAVYERLIERGMSQGRRTRPVKVRVCLGDGDAVAASKERLSRLGLARNENRDDGIARIFLDCGDETTTSSTGVPPPARDIVLRHCRRRRDDADGSIPKVVVAVGPERGWTDEEAAIFVRDCGFESASLGSSILRVDTAVIAGLGIISASLDECWNGCGRSLENQKRQKVI
mmetsp:Transcript_27268/g.57377  ORF Transcript_27268/g.57377 Transcript_27268/m.57377 type:complete len:348 (-) Transcript_27268:4348-5391(-)